MSLPPLLTHLHYYYYYVFHMAWIGLGHLEKVSRLTYVALSRVRQLYDLIIEPMTFERLHSLQKSSSYKFRLLEEQRLNHLANIMSGY